MTKKEAQAALNFHPDSSPYWDSDAGQEVLQVVRELGLTAKNTNRRRCAIYAQERRMIAELEQWSSDVQQAFDDNMNESP